MAFSCTLVVVPLRFVRSLGTVAGCSHGGHQERAGGWCKEVNAGRELLSL